MKTITNAFKSTLGLLVTATLVFTTGPSASAQISIAADIWPGAAAGNPSELTVHNGELYFRANNGSTGNELFKFDGTNVSLVANIRPGSASGAPQRFEVHNGGLYFRANNGSNGNELFRYDGSSATLIADINVGGGNSNPADLTSYNGELVFAATAPVEGREPFVYDGSSSSNLANIMTGNSPSNPQDFTEYNGVLYFHADHPGLGKELTSYDGASVAMVQDFVSGPGSLNPLHMAVYNNKLFFSGSDGVNGQELMSYDGSTIALEADIWLGGSLQSSNPTNLMVYNGELLFRANDGVNGTELWSFDGTTASLVADINPGSANSLPNHFEVYNGRFYFAAQGPSGVEIYVYDGTTVSLLEDLVPGSGSSFPSFLTTFNNKLYFKANAGLGNELYVYEEFAPSNVIWEGNTNSDWNTGSNWSTGSVPSNTGDVVIPDVANDPIISGNVTINDITLESGATLGVSLGGTLTLDGTLDNSGSVTVQSGGSFLQGGSSSITGSGSFQVQRQGTSGSAFNYWSSPMQSFSGVPGSATYLFNPNTATESYADDLDPDPGWITHSGSMTPGRGYAGSGAGLVTFSGIPNNGNVNYPLTYYPASPGNTSPGSPSNLCGNPYPSAISCMDLVTTNTDIDGAIYFWDDDLSGGSDYSNSDYAVWNGTGSLGTGGGTVAPNGYIASCQGFMVRAATGGAVLNFTNSMRSGNSAPFFREASNEDSRMWLSLSNAELRSQMLFAVLEDATDDRDRLYDAEKIRGSNDISLASMIDTDEFCIQAVAPSDMDRIVPLMTKVSLEGEFTFRVDSIEGFGSGEMVLFDNLDGEMYPLTQGAEYTFNVSPSDEYGRFQLGVGAVHLTYISNADKHATIAIFISQDGLVIDQAKAGMANIGMFDMMGRIVWSQSANLSEGRNLINIPETPAGQYIIRVISSEESTSKQFILN